MELQIAHDINQKRDFEKRVNRSTACLVMLTHKFGLAVSVILHEAKLLLGQPTVLLHSRLFSN